MEKQLTLRVGLSDHASFDNFFVGPNTEVIAALYAFLEEAAGGLIFFFGARGSGKTHLLYAAQKSALAKSHRAAYLCMSDLQVVEQLTNFVEHGDLLCIDDVHHVAGSNRMEKVLFNLIEQQMQLTGSVIMTSAQPAQKIPFVMPDLASRVSSGAAYRIRPLSDAQKKDALRLRARHRGIELSGEVINYVMKRYSRDASSLFTLLDQIDQASLSRQRLVTIPFLKQLETNKG